MELSPFINLVALASKQIIREKKLTFSTKTPVNTLNQSMVVRPRHLTLFLRGNTISQLRGGRSVCRNRVVGELFPVNSKLVNNIQKSHFHCGVCSRSIFANHETEVVDTDMPNYGQAMEAWYYDVNREGRLVVRSGMDVHIQPLNPQKHPDMNKLFINIMYMGKDKLTSTELVALTKNYIVNVDLDDKNEEMEISIKQKTSLDVQAQVHMQVPIKYDIEVSCSRDGDASLAQLEAETLKVRTHQGDCIFRNIKGVNVDISTRDGSVISHSLLQGNTNIVCNGKGGVRAGRIQGQKVAVHSEHGDVAVKAVYADSAMFTSTNGDIHLGSCHGNTEVNLKQGNLKVDTLDGNLEGRIDSGNTQLALSREGNVNLSAENGDISLKVPESLNTRLDLNAVEIDQGEVTLYNTKTSTQSGLTQLKGDLSKEDADSAIQASTQSGKIQLCYYDWLSSLNLGKDSAS